MFFLNPPFHRKKFNQISTRDLSKSDISRQKTPSEVMVQSDGERDDGKIVERDFAEHKRKTSSLREK